MVAQRKLKHSFSYALHGLSRAWREQQNFRIQVVVAVIVFFAAAILRVRQVDFLFLFSACIVVLLLELLNTIFEHFTNFFSPRYSTAAQTVKDMMAATVLLASVGALIIGVIIFTPYIRALLPLAFGI